MMNLKRASTNRLIKYFLLLLAFLPGLAYSQAPVTDIDTSTSRTKLYAALTAKNILYKREEYDLETDDVIFSAVILKRLDDGSIVKGCRLYSNGFGWRGSAAKGYIDEAELDGIITTIKYISDSIDLRKRAPQDVWVYYKTVDDFEIGARAVKGKRYDLYMEKNYRFLTDRSVSVGRFNLTEAYKSFVYVRDFLKSH